MPLFETESDRIKQRKVADKFSERLGVEVHMTAGTAEYDLFAYDPDDESKVLFIGEVKCRECLPDTYPDVFLSKDKREDVEAWAKKLNTTPLFIVRYKNGKIRFVELGADKDFGEPQYLGRKDRGAAKDMEMMYNVSNSLLIDF